MMNVMRRDITSQIGENLRRARKRKHLTQQDVSDRIGISRAMIGKYETGDVEISMSIFFAICSAIGCDPKSIIDGVEE